MARKAEIKTELKEADEKRLAELSTEVDALTKEETEIRSRMDLTGKLGNPEPKPQNRKADEAEERGKALMEKRSVTIASTGVILPEYQASDIKPTFNEVSSLIDNVNIKTFKGGESFKQPYLAGYGTGDYEAEGVAPDSNAEPTFGYAEITKTKAVAEDWKKKNCRQLHGQEVVKGISVAAVKKINRNGALTGQPVIRWNL